MSKEEIKNVLELTFTERLVLGTVLPTEGDMMTILVVKDLKDKVMLNQEILKDVEWSTLGSNATWNADKAERYSMTLDLTSVELKILKEAVSRLNTEKKITLENLSFARKVDELKSEI